MFISVLFVFIAKRVASAPSLKITNLMLVPETCKECYFKSKDEASVIFKKKIESDCNEKLKQAQPTKR
jgi:hypothetical protein